MNATSSTMSPESQGPRLVDSSKMRRWIRISLKVGVGAAVVTGLIGALHFPFAAPLLRVISPASVCPVVRGTPEQIDRAHALGAASIRNSAKTAAPVRPALGFELDKSTKADLDIWAAKHGVSCKNIAGNETLQRCTKVPAVAVGQSGEMGPLEEVTFEFQKSGQLVNVQTLRRNLTAQQAALAVGELERRASATLGSPSSTGGEPTVAHLSRSLLSTYVATHAFNDYRATVSATNLAHTGVMVREEYLSAR